MFLSFRTSETLQDHLVVFFQLIVLTRKLFNPRLLLGDFAHSRRVFLLGQHLFDLGQLLLLLHVGLAQPGLDIHAVGLVFGGIFLVGGF